MFLRQEAEIVARNVTEKICSIISVDKGPMPMCGKYTHKSSRMLCCLSKPRTLGSCKKVVDSRYQYDKDMI